MKRIMRLSMPCKLWFHYNKARPEWGPLDAMLIHAPHRRIAAPQGLVCHFPSESLTRDNEQPRIVMECWASRVEQDPTGKLHIFA